MKNQDRAIDFEYLKLTVALVLLLIVVFLITSYFRMCPTVESTNTGFAAGASAGPSFAGSTESFAPYASVLIPSVFRTDPSHDDSKLDIPPYYQETFEYDII